MNGDTEVYIFHVQFGHIIVLVKQIFDQMMTLQFKVIVHNELVKWFQVNNGTPPGIFLGYQKKV
jgi:hypothetical protein